MEGKLTVIDWPHGDIHELLPHDVALGALIPDLPEQRLTLDDEAVLHALSEAGFEAGVQRNLMVDVVGDAEGDGGVSLDDRGEEIQTNLGADTVHRELSRLHQPLSIQNTTS